MPSCGWRCSRAGSVTGDVGRSPASVAPSPPTRRQSASLPAGPLPVARRASARAPVAGARAVWRRKFAAAEHDVAANCEGVRLHGIGSLARVGIGMNAHPAEIASETRSYERAGLRIKRAGRRTQHVVHYRRRKPARGPAVIPALTLQRQMLRPASHIPRSHPARRRRRICVARVAPAFARSARRRGRLLVRGRRRAR